MSSIKQILGVGLLGAALLSLAAPALAGHVTFNYSGIGGGGSVTDTGTGSFDFAGSPSSLLLADLTAFSFTDNVTVLPNSATFTYGLADLTAFSATITSGAITSLSLTTSNIPPSSSTTTFPSLYFKITSLGDAGLLRSVDNSSYTAGLVTTNGPGTPPSSVPLPSTLALLIPGLWVVGFQRRRSAV